MKRMVDVYNNAVNVGDCVKFILNPGSTNREFKDMFAYGKVMDIAEERGKIVAVIWRQGSEARNMWRRYSEHIKLEGK